MLERTDEPARSQIQKPGTSVSIAHSCCPLNLMAGHGSHGGRGRLFRRRGHIHHQTALLDVENADPTGPEASQQLNQLASDPLDSSRDVSGLRRHVGMDFSPCRQADREAGLHRGFDAAAGWCALINAGAPQADNAVRSSAGEVS